MTTKILRAADALYTRRREGPYRFIQNRPRVFAVSLTSDAAAEKPRDRFSRDFLGYSIFDFCNSIRQKLPVAIQRRLLLESRNCPSDWPCPKSSAKGDVPPRTHLGGFAAATSIRQIRDTHNIRRKIRLGGEDWLNDLRFNNCGFAGWRFDGCQEGAAGIRDLPPAVVSDNIAAGKNAQIRRARRQALHAV